MLRVALAFLLFAASAAHAQVRGRIFDARTGEGVSGAHVQLAGGAVMRDAITSAAGAYEFADVPSGEYRLVIAHPGYDSAAVRVLLGLGRDVVLDVPLVLRPFPVARIVVEGERGIPRNGGGDSSAADSLELALAGRRASLVGPQSASALADMVASDLAREPPTDPSGGRRPHVLYIWGSSGERGRVLLDGASLNAPLHLGALLPPMDPDLLSGAALRSGGISPRYDGGTAYILDFDSRPAIAAEHRAWGELDLIAARVGAAAPVGDGGIIVGARRVNDEVVDVLLGRPFGYRYADALVRGDVPLGESAGRIQATFFATREAIEIPRDLSVDEAFWRNLATAVAWHGGEPSRRATLRATWSRGVADLPLLSAPGGHVDATMDRLTATAERRWSIGSVGGLVGAEYEHLRFHRRGSADFDPTVPGSTVPAACTSLLPCFEADAHVLAGFAELVWQPAPRVAASAGFRLRFDPYSGEVGMLPRATLSTMLGSSAAVALSAGRFSQTHVALPGDAGALGHVPGAYAAVTHANHFELGVRRRAGRSAVNASLFVRHHENGPETDARVTPGFDVSWAWASDAASLSLGYSLVGRRASLAGDATAIHQLAGAGFGARRGAVHFSASTAYGHGMPLTSIVLERSDDVASPAVGESYRTISGSSAGDPAAPRGYVRVDAALGAEWRVRWSGRELAIVPYGKIINAFSQRDALFYYHEAGTPGEPRPLGAMPTVPVVGIRWQF